MGGRKYRTGEQITVADYFASSIVALGDLIRHDFGRHPNVAAWLDRMKALPNWKPASEAIDVFGASLEGQRFIAA